MGYFANGTEGDVYQEKYCEHCFNSERDSVGCSIWDAHMVFGDNEFDIRDLLDILIPRDAEGRNQQCTMYKPVGG